MKTYWTITLGVCVLLAACVLMEGLFSDHHFLDLLPQALLLCAVSFYFLMRRIRQPDK